MILKNLSNALPVVRWDSPSRGRKPHEGSSTDIAVPGTKGLATASSHHRGQFHDSSITTGAQGFGPSPHGPTPPAAARHGQSTVTYAGKQPLETVST